MRRGHDFIVGIIIVTGISSSIVLFLIGIAVRSNLDGNVSGESVVIHICPRWNNYHGDFDAAFEGVGADGNHAAQIQTALDTGTAFKGTWADGDNIA